MIFKRLLILLVLTNLTACATLERFMQSSEPKAPEQSEEASQEASVDKIVESADGETVEQVSPEQALAQSLHAQADLYEQSKGTLSVSVMSKISGILASYKAGDFARSESDMNSLLGSELNLTSPVYMLAGDIAYAQNNQQKAKAYYQQALQLNSYNAKAANRLARLHRLLGKFEEALALYTRAIEASPSHAESYRNRAVLYDLYLNEKAKAFEDYQTYSALLNYQLAAQEHPTLTNNAAKLPEDELKTLKTDIKLVKRWLADVGRQVAALNRQQSAQAGGN